MLSRRAEWVLKSEVGKVCKAGIEYIREQLVFNLLLFIFGFCLRRAMPPKKKLRLIDLLSTEPDSKLALLLIRKWSWGLYSASEVGVLAREALADQKALLEKVGAPANFASQSLEMLANIGSQGSHQIIQKYTHTQTHTTKQRDTQHIAGIK